MDFTIKIILDEKMEALYQAAEIAADFVLHAAGEAEKAKGTPNARFCQLILAVAMDASTQAELAVQAAENGF
jgi:hypothetical protein